MNRCLLAIAIASTLPTLLVAQTMPPVLQSWFPRGGQRGATVEMEFKGDQMAGASAILFSGSGVSGEIIPPKKEMGTPTAAKITVAKDAPLGAREFRIVTPRGASSIGYFVVSNLPEIIEEEPNDTPAEARKPIASDDPKAKPKERVYSVPLVINGRLDSKEDVDCFWFRAKAGQTLVFEAAGVAIGALTTAGQFLDTHLALLDATGRKLAENDDFRSKDSLLVYTFPRAGEYVLQINDTNYKNNGAFAYRVSIAPRPFVTGVFPLGATRGKTAKLELIGFNLGKGASVKAAIPPDAPLGRRDVQVSPQQTWPILIGDLPEVFEKEPNNSPSQAQKISAPVTINGRIGAPGDTDCFAFTLKKGERIKCEVQADRLGSPLDSFLTLTYPLEIRELGNGMKVADALSQLDAVAVMDMQKRQVYLKADDSDKKDSIINFTAPADMSCLLELRDLARRGGTDYSYRLTVAPPRPDFELTVEPDNIVVGRGGRVLVTVRANRTDGFNDAIDLKLFNLSAGAAVISTRDSSGLHEIQFFGKDGVVKAPNGATVVQIPNPVDPNKMATVELCALAAGRNEAFILLTARPDAPLAAQPLTIEGSAKIGSATVARRAVPIEGRNIGGARATHEVSLMTVSVGEKADIVIYAPAETAPAMAAAGAPPPPAPPAPAPLTLKPSGKLDLKVKAVRNGFKGEITLRAVNLPAGVTSSEAKINGDVQDATITLTSANAAETTATIFVAGVIAKPPVLSVTHSSAPLALQIKK